MIDLHCHILPGVDDGSRSIEETLQILKEAEKVGFHTICLTPHYADPTYLNTKVQNSQILNQVKAKAKEENIQIKLLLGNEIFINANIETLLRNGEIASLADSKYALVELPMYQELPKEVVHKIFENIRNQGFRIIMAHPERYDYIQENPEKILEYFDEDVIFQSNYASILGVYRKDAQNTVKWLLKNRIIHLLSSDVHSINRCFYSQFELIKEKILEVIDEEYFEILTEKNPSRIIENKGIIKCKRNIEKTSF